MESDAALADWHRARRRRRDLQGLASWELEYRIIQLEDALRSLGAYLTNSKSEADRKLGNEIREVVEGKP